MPDGLSLITSRKKSLITKSSRIKCWNSKRRKKSIVNTVDFFDYYKIAIYMLFRSRESHSEPFF